MYIDLGKLMGPLIWGRPSDGLIASMFAGFFDDSGTHAGSRVAVWGGLLGPVAEFEKLDVAWRALLKAPMEGKPPLSKFSLAQCISGEREFDGYNQAERDSIRYRFRRLIDDVDLAPIAYAVDAEAWDAILTPTHRAFLGAAQNMAFDGCLEAAVKFGTGEGKHLSLHFDVGQSSRSTRAVLAAFEFKHPKFEENVSITFSPVAALTGLQAADMVAGEAYRYFLRYRESAEPDKEPHFQDLIKNNGAIFMYFGREEIESFLPKWERKLGPVLEQLMRVWGR